jgi:hypothetical protein
MVATRHAHLVCTWRVHLVRMWCAWGMLTADHSGCSSEVARSSNSYEKPRPTTGSSVEARAAASSLTLRPRRRALAATAAGGAAARHASAAEHARAHGAAGRGAAGRGAPGRRAARRPSGGRAVVRRV